MFFSLSYFGYLVVCTKCSLTYNIKCYVSWLLEQPSKEMCCEVVLFVPMLLCNWAVIWMPLLIFPYVLSLVVQMQLDPHVNPIPSTNCLSVCLAICLLTCLPGCISTADMMVVNTHTRARAHAHARTHTHTRRTADLMPHCKHDIRTQQEVINRAESALREEACSSSSELQWELAGCLWCSPWWPDRTVCLISFSSCRIFKRKWYVMTMIGSLRCWFPNPTSWINVSSDQT